MNQSDLTRWTAGFFDGDGNINNSIGKSSECKVDHQIDTSCRVGSTYVSGVFDAEGCISAEIGTKDSYSVGYAPKTACRMNHCENDPLANRLIEFCDNIGVEYTLEHTERDGNYSDIFSFGVRRRDDVVVFLNELLPYLTVKRKQAEIMVNDLVPLLKEGVHSTRRGFLRVMHHVDRMNELKGGQRGDYNVEYFEDLWGMEYDPTHYD